MTGEFDPKEVLQEDADKAARLLADLEAGGGSSDDIMLAKMDADAKLAMLDNPNPADQPRYPTPPPPQSIEPLNINPGRTVVDDSSAQDVSEQKTGSIRYETGARAIAPSHQLAADAAQALWSRPDKLIDTQEIPLANTAKPEVDYDLICKRFMEGDIEINEVRPPTNSLERKLARRAIQELTESEIKSRPEGWNEKFFRLQTVLNRA